jgi:hypothetical protein
MHSVEEKLSFLIFNANVLYSNLHLKNKCTFSGTLLLSIGVSTLSFEL